MPTDERIEAVCQLQSRIGQLFNCGNRGNPRLEGEIVAFCRLAGITVDANRLAIRRDCASNEVEARLRDRDSHLHELLTLARSIKRKAQHAPSAGDNANNEKGAATYSPKPPAVGSAQVSTGMKPPRSQVLKLLDEWRDFVKRVSGETLSDRDWHTANTLERQAFDYKLGGTWCEDSDAVGLARFGRLATPCDSSNGRMKLLATKQWLLDLDNLRFFVEQNWPVGHETPATPTTEADKLAAINALTQSLTPAEQSKLADVWMSANRQAIGDFSNTTHSGVIGVFKTMQQTAHTVTATAESKTTGADAEGANETPAADPLYQLKPSDRKLFRLFQETLRVHGNELESDTVRAVHTYLSDNDGFDGNRPALSTFETAVSNGRKALGISARSRRVVSTGRSIVSVRELDRPDDD